MNFTRDPLSTIRAALATATRGDPSVKIGLVDGVPDLRHPALREAPVDILGVMVPEGAARADRHGTQVASILFGQDAGVQGLCSSCSGLALPIFFRDHGGRERPASQLDLARALEFGLERDVSIFDVSAGQKVSVAEPDAHLSQALERCVERRALVVAAAGNDGCACLHLPAGVSSVLAVGAHDENGPLDSSNWAAAYKQNGLLAPGRDLLVAELGGEAGRATGTSHATAVVAGVAALLLSVARQEGLQADALDIQSILLETATPCILEDAGACDRFLAGQLDAAAALRRLRAIGSVTSSSMGLGPRHSEEASPISFAEVNHMSEAIDVGSALAPSACDCQKKDDTSQQDRAHGKADGSLKKSEHGPASPTSEALSQQGCGCGGGEPPQIVYAIGSLWFDFGTEARHDLFVQQMGDLVRANNPHELILFLRENPQYATGITFILMQEQIPLYAIQPAGPFALQIYSAMLDALTSSIDDGGMEQRISLPGLVSGSTRLLNGMTIPVVFPDLRGMFKWQSAHLIETTRVAVEAIRGAIESPEGSDDAILNFLNRVYYELRNLGIAPQDRAMNFAATNAFQARQVLADAAARSLALDSIRVMKSPICRPDSDCWDVELVMFDDDDERKPNRIYRFTVDVSEVVPVTVGAVRHWAARAR